ncbi:MAG: epoxyqueuosine reductase QueH [Patescibacteria group bacterium]
MFYFLIFLAALVLTALLSAGVRQLAFYWQVLDRPDSNPSQGRKIHTQATPLLGGLAIFSAYFILLFLFSRHFLAGNLEWSHLLGFFGGALIISIGGILDDRYNLAPQRQIIFPLLAIIAVIGGGVEIVRLSNPLGGLLDLRSLFFISPIIISLWLLGMMYTTKLLDGVDGLVSGIVAIGGFIIFLFTLTTRYYQPDIAFAAILLSGASLGFLIWNWHPAKIFLGEGGSLLLGYILGVLAIISGAKIAIALLIMGIPILDVVWTIMRRLSLGKNPFRFADREHLHHRLLNLGLSQRQTVSIFYILSLVFGLSGLFLQSRGKFLALLVLVVIMLLLVIGFWAFDRQRQARKNLVRTRSDNDGAPNLKKTLLLHICCAPCGTYISQYRLASRFSITWYFYNPNLASLEEYEKRLAAVKAMAAKFNFSLLIEPYEHSAWQTKTSGRAADAERGERCRICYRDRLEATGRLASQEKFDYFSTTLLVSPYKDAAAIKAISREIAGLHAVTFLDEDFQADNAYRLSQDLAKELGLYRQKFCGCEYYCSLKL